MGKHNQTNLYVASLPTRDFAEEDLRKIFEPFGNVVGVYLLRDPATGRGKGCGFVCFDTADSAQLASEQVLRVSGKKLQVRFADRHLYFNNAGVPPPPKPNLSIPKMPTPAPPPSWTQTAMGSSGSFNGINVMYPAPPFSALSGAFVAPPLTLEPLMAIPFNTAQGNATGAFQPQTTFIPIQTVIPQMPSFDVHVPDSSVALGAHMMFAQPSASAVPSAFFAPAPHGGFVDGSSFFSHTPSVDPTQASLPASHETA